MAAIYSQATPNQLTVEIYIWLIKQDVMGGGIFIATRILTLRKLKMKRPIHAPAI